MLLNLSVIAFLIGLLVALNITSLLPVFIIRFLTRFKIYTSGSLGYEKYQHTDSTNRTSTRSRYFHRNAENFKTTITGKIYFIMILISVLVAEIIGLGLYWIVIS